MKISQKFLDNQQAWYWNYLSQFRDPSGRSLAEIEGEREVKMVKEMGEAKWWPDRWKWSPKPFVDVLEMVKVIERFYPRDASFNYLEFGCCFGTTIAWVLKHFPNARGIGLERMDFRYQVSSWLLNNLENKWNLKGRYEIRHQSILDVSFQRHQFDVTFMDTDHQETDYQYILHLLEQEYLKPKFLFLGDDPFHTGTKISRERFIANFGDRYPITTEENLWFFHS